ncbi:MAG: PEP-CTERM system histidine kinase PrsK [Methylococcaceae bacterium]|nr:PEP-CTERM system histidine kinase PrsK [Methylococcaceae bacterium]
MDSFGLYSYVASTITYFLLLIFALARVNKNPLGIPIVIALIFSLFWTSYIVLILQSNELYIQDTFPVETLRNLAWFFFLSVLISKQQFNSKYYLIKNSWQVPFILLLTICVVILEYFSELRYQIQQFTGFDFRLFAHICFAIIGLMLVEQLYRNALHEQRWAIKFLSLGLAAIFAFDFVLYSKSLLFNILDTSLWESRGIVNALTAPLLATSIIRQSQEQIRVQVSNKVIFHTTVLLGAGVYLLLMSLAGSYLKVYGGSWGAVAQISFIFLAILLLLVFFVSGKIRAVAKIYLGKNFFQHRYDYRDEWIKLSKKIAELNSLDDLSPFIVHTLANFVDSSGGGLWVKNDQGDYFLSSEHNLGNHSRQLVGESEPLINFFKTKQWVIDFVEYFNDPDIYAGSGLDKWYAELKEIWLIIPLFQENNLQAFVVLTQPKVSRQIDWEDHDLLKTVGMQLANALALTQASDDLTRAKQFEAYNRFSAFLVHDLKNLVAQISLIVKNSEKHKRNPAFIDDSIDTLENVVKKIDQILGQLKKGKIRSIYTSKINLANILEEVVKQQASNSPSLCIEMDDDEYMVMGEKEKMIAILGHLVQNAQEATADDGIVKIVANRKENDIELKIIDTGCGMEEKFIQQRLFKPFDTTKGNAGMGIGVYEARELILQQSGKISVESKLGQGTTFTIYLPEAI